MSNFTARVISSIVGGAAMIALIIIGGPLLLWLLCALSIIGFFELTKACKVHEEGKKINSLEAVGVIASICWYGAIQLESLGIVKLYAPSMGFMVIVLGIMACMVVYVLTFPRFHANQVIGAAFSFIYCPVMLSFMYLIRALDYGVYLVWLVFVCSWFCDIFAYLVGVKIGKHKFVPKLSPKKSTEGAIGGVLGSMLIGGLYAKFIVIPNINSVNTTKIYMIILVISAIGAMISMFGDLAASAIKRNHEIKDYGKLIPGHGGIMDRFDSVIFVAPLVYCLSLIFVTYIG